MLVRNGKLRRRYGQVNPQPQVVTQPNPNGQFQQAYQPTPTQPAPQQQYQPQPQFTPPAAPVVSQQTAPQPAQQTFTLPLPNLTALNVSQQQTGQPSPDAWSAIHTSIATSLGIQPDQAKQLIGNDPNNIATIVKRGFEIQQQLRNRELTPPSQTTAPAQPAPAAVQPTGPVMYDLPQGWENTVRQNPESGIFEPMHPSYAQFAAMANHNQQLQRSRLIEISRDPSKVLQFPEVQKLMDARMEQKLNEYIGQRELQTQQESFWNENGKHLVQKDFYGNEVKTPLGEAFSGALKQLGDSGMKPGKTLYETALMMAQKQAGPIQQAQPQQGQGHVQGPQNPANQPTWGGYQAQQQPNNGQILPQQTQANVDPVRQMLDMNSQQNRIYPGSAPNRAAAPYQSTREAMLASVADMPDGLPIGAYLNRMNGRM